MIRRCLTAKLSFFALLGAATFLLTTIATQASLPNGTPARPVMRDLWGDLEPAESPDLALPKGRDSTSYNEFGTIRYWNAPWWMSIDIENNLIFTVGSQSLQIWDPTGRIKAGGTPDNPALVGSTNKNAIIDPVGGEAATGWPMRDLDLPKGVDTVAAVVGNEMGLTIWNTSSKTQPVNVYQYPGEGLEVYATTLGGRQYAFMAAAPGGVLAFDMTQAVQLGHCLDNAAGTACSGVYQGHVGSFPSASYIDGEGNYVAAAGGVGVQIYDVSQIASAKIKLDAFKTEQVRGVALWKDVDSSAYYLSVVVSFFQAGLHYEGRIYNVSCITTAGGCTALGSPLATIDLGTTQGQRTFATLSRSGPAIFLYYGTDNRTGDGPQREFLVDVTDPEDPLRTRDITPQGKVQFDGHALDYWSWYYEGNNGPSNENGFNGVGPRRGMFLGEYFYRAAWSIFDIHRRAGGLPPAAEFDWASLEPDGKIYPGSMVDFFDRSTGRPDAWSWFFGSGTPSTSALRDPRVTFNSTGPFPKQVSVTLTAFNSVGQSNPVTHTLQVLDPAPKVTGIAANVQSATVCQPITFTADGVSGKSPLGFSWRILDTQNLQVVPPTTPSTNPSKFVWQTSPSLLPGSYAPEVTVSGVSGTTPAVLKGGLVNITALPSLPAAGSFTPTNDPFIAATVDFHVAASGATEWNWDFGDGHISGWISDPIDGPNQSHTYDEIGTYEVTVQVRNCTNPTSPITSAPLEVVVESITLLHAELNATDGVKVSPIVGGGFILTAELGKPITFEDLSTGAESWEYDWDGNGSFEDGPLSQPRTQHTYTQQGTFSPRLRVRRGASETDVFTHGEIAVGTSTPSPGPGPTPTPNPSISISGPSTGSPGTSISFTATAKNCSASANGWTWTTFGGETTGSTTGRTIAISWSSTGRKTITAQNSGCGAARGSTAVNITDSSTPGPGPEEGELAAVFTFAPQEPKSGEAVSFDGSASTGGPENWAWDFGDGSKPVGTKTGSTQHTYAAAGTYKVSLAVSKPGACIPVFNICSSLNTVKTLVVKAGDGKQPSPGESQTLCSDDPEALCLLGGRFKVKVTWTDPRSGDSGVGKPMPVEPLPGQDATGFFWFFNPNSVDLIAKMIDGGTANGNFWFFSGGLSDVEYEITVEDQEAEEPTVKTYENGAGNICGLADTEAFPQVANLPGGQNVALTGYDLGALGNLGAAASEGGEVTGDTSPCEPGLETLCLLDGRFEVKVNWRDPRTTNSGTGRAIQGTQESGYFWFFSPSNVELVMKMIDARTVNDHFWVFYGALSDVEYDIAVRDTETGITLPFSNPAGNICGLANTEAFE